ncbi:MAG: hypothetical protein GTN78_17930, partial [Gemmatimonadales bacterium]|nr:hypothetical protein [Gemmatimonadales bacterium]
MECTEVRQKLVEAVEGELPSPEEAAVRQHVAECSDCRSEFKRLRRASGALNTVVSQLAPPTRYLTRRRLDLLMFAYSERHRPIRLVTWRRFVAAAAVAAIIAAVPFIVGDVAHILNAPPVPRLVAQQPPPADPVAVILSVASTAHEGDG